MFMRCKVTIDTSHYPKEWPWELPEGWLWLSGEDVFLPMESTSPKGDFFNYIDIDAIDNVKNLIEAPKHIPVKDAPSRASRKVCRGDVLFSMVRPYLRNIALVEQENCIASTGFYVCRCSGILDSKYCFYLMLSDYVVEGLNQFMKGDNSPSINNSHITSWLYPIPPLTEQKRISMAIEQLLFYTNRLNDAEAYIGDKILEVKGKILNLAIHGKLVPQNPADEPAIEFLKRINPSFTPSHNLHYEGIVPKGWQLCQLSDIFDVTMGQSPEGNSLNTMSGIEFHQGKLCFTEKYLSKSEVLTSSPTKYAISNSLLCCVRAPVGIFNITLRKICIGRGLCALTPRSDSVELDYWFYALSSYRDYYEDKATGTTFKAISGEVIRNTMVLLPPELEQRRILKRITELFSILDQISNPVDSTEQVLNS